MLPGDSAGWKCKAADGDIYGDERPSSAPGTAALRHLHIRAGARHPEGLYIWQLLNAGYTDNVRKFMRNGFL